MSEYVQNRRSEHLSKLRKEDGPGSARLAAFKAEEAACGVVVQKGRPKKVRKCCGGGCRKDWRLWEGLAVVGWMV